MVYIFLIILLIILIWFVLEKKNLIAKGKKEVYK